MTTSIWSAAVQAALAGETVGIAAGVEFFFASETMALWPGQGTFDTSAKGGPVFRGVGQMGQIGAVELGAVAATQAVTFSLSGLDATLYAYAQNQGVEVRGRRANCGRSSSIRRPSRSSMCACAARS